jgi:hypothetical protein
MRGISWPAEKLFAYQEVLSLMWLFSWLIRKLNALSL